MKIIKPRIWNSIPRLETIQSTRDKICISTSEGHTIISKDEISRLNADNNYTSIYYNNKVLVCSQTISAIIDKISHPDFIRIHKSHVININYLKMIDRSFSTVTLDDGNSYAVSRSKKQELKGVIKRRFD